MYSNKMLLTTKNEYKLGKYIILFLAILIVSVLATNSKVFAAGSVKAEGMLTSIEDDGSVIINGKGYLVSPSAIVQDYRGDSVPVQSFLPSRYVKFEYMYGSKGFVIIFMKEVPQ